MVWAPQHVGEGKSPDDGLRTKLHTNDKAVTRVYASVAKYLNFLWKDAEIQTVKIFGGSLRSFRRANTAGLTFI